MNILHVTIGDIYKKNGGLSKYCKELSEIQIANGDICYYLFPGNLALLSGKTKIKKKSNNTFILKNSLPVSITYGVDNPNRYIKKCSNIKVFENFFKQINVDIIHIHSIQGIYKEFFEVANKLNIPMVITTHDYFPICPMTNRLYNNDICYYRNSERCSICNLQCRFNWKKQLLYQSCLFDKIKNNKIFIKLKKANKTMILENNQIECNPKKLYYKNDFEKLINYYNELLSNINAIHYNSNLSKQVYQHDTSFKIEKVIPIMPKLSERTIHHKKSKGFFNIGFLGGPNKIKGFNLLRECCKDLLLEGINNYCINYYGGIYNDENTNNEKFYGYFNENEAASVWEKIDILVAPSICLETFGFVIIEALNRCIPVICSDTCGAQDFINIINKQCVFESNNRKSFVEALKFLLNDTNYNDVQKKIINKNFNFDFNKHVNSIRDYYNNIIILTKKEGGKY